MNPGSEGEHPGRPDLDLAAQRAASRFGVTFHAEGDRTFLDDPEPTMRDLWIKGEVAVSEHAEQRALAA